MAYDRFPHLTGATSFPGDNVDVYKYRNEFDYTRWGADARLKLCNVPWCGDYDNVVAFDSIEARDAWLDALPEPEGAVAFAPTMIQVKPDGTVKLPLNVTNVQKYNYLVVDIPTPTSTAQPIEYATLPRTQRFLYFIDDATQGAASTTQCRVRLDMWQTFVYDMDFEYLMLDRGHAPMAEVTVDEYLANPRGTCDLLLAPDVDAGRERSNTATQVAHIINADETWTVFFTYAQADGGTWGTESASTWTTPANPYTGVQGAAAPLAFAVEVSDLQGFLNAVDSQVPQFKACVLGLAFISKSLCNVAADFTFCGYACHTLTATEQRATMLDITRDVFRYEEPYAYIAKLYTYPYAAIEVSDTDGGTTLVRIEDTTGTIDIVESLSLVFPWVNVDCRLLGIGGVSESSIFYTSGQRQYTYGGSFASTLKTWGVPVYQVAQSGARDAAWSGFYARAQAQLAADNAYSNAITAADTARDSGNASNATAQANANRSASNVTANNALAVAANTALTAIANEAASDGTHQSNGLLAANTSWTNDTCTANYEAELAGLAVTAANNQAQAAMSGVNTVLGVVGNLATGNVLGAVTTGISGAMNTAVGWDCANAVQTVSQSNAQSIYDLTIAANNASMNNSTSYNNASTNIQNDQRSDNNTTQNNLSTATATNNANLVTSNAQATRDTADANVTRAHTLATNIAGTNLNTAESAIANQLRQQGLRAPITHGVSQNGEHAATRPLGYVARVVTESRYAIRTAGDAFLRYGYQLGQQWRLTAWQVMRHFTYWQCSEVWCTGPGNAIEGAQQAIKDILVRGVTVWSDPDEIGKVSIYDNI